MSHSTQLCVVILLLWYFTLPVNSLSLANRTSAAKLCQNASGLLSYDTFTGVNSSKYLASNALNIIDGDSAWISGFVSYSKFVSWEGCYDNVKGYEMPFVQQKDGSVFFCLGMCSNTQGIDRIGVSEGLCHCISSGVLGDSQRMQNSTCVSMDNYLVPGVAYGLARSTINYGNNIHVYKIHDNEESLRQPPVNKFSWQCVYVEKVTSDSGSNNTSVEFKTKSCYAKEGETVSGMICVAEISHRLTGNCWTVLSGSRAYCLMQSSSNWPEANNQCRLLQGKLVENITKELVEGMEINVRYWTGLFRDFKKITSTAESNEGEVCLSLRKVGDGFRIDPASCSEAKRVQCQTPTWQDVASPRQDVASPGQDVTSPKQDVTSPKQDVTPSRKDVKEDKQLNRNSSYITAASNDSVSFFDNMFNLPMTIALTLNILFLVTFICAACITCHVISKKLNRLSNKPCNICSLTEAGTVWSTTADGAVRSTTAMGAVRSTHDAEATVSVPNKIIGKLNPKHDYLKPDRVQSTSEHKYESIKDHELQVVETNKGHVTEKTGFSRACGNLSFY